MTSFNYEKLGNGLTFQCFALASDSNYLYAGGDTISGNRISRWNGVTWSSLGTGLTNVCRALAVDSQNNLYAGGDFTTAGGISANYVAKWDGSSWSALGTGLGFICRALVFDNAGNLYAGGDFTTAGGISANRVARWNGSSWFALGTGLNNVCNGLTVDSQNNLYAAGIFTTAGGSTANRVAKWNGSSWSTFSTGLTFDCYSIAITPAGDLYVGGFSLSSSVLARWSGTSWVNIGITNSGVYALTQDFQGNVYAGGRFNTPANPGNSIARWNGSSWSDLGGGITPGSSNDVFAIHINSNGVYIGGIFSSAGGSSGYNNITLLKEITSTSSLYQINGNNVYQTFFPVGCITAYIGTQTSGQAGYDPDGWLVCDGRTIGNQIPYDSKYNALLNFLQSYTIPNLNGAFLRGTGSYDPSRNGPALKKFQTDDFKSHNHTITCGERGSGGDGSSASMFFTGGNTSSTSATRNQDTTLVSSSTDTRPLNYGVKWIIKY